MKNRVWTLIAVFTGSVLVMTCVYDISSYRSNSPNAFIRKLPSHPFNAENVKDLKNANFYIAGQKGHELYLANYQLKNILYKMSLKNLDTTQIALNVPRTFKLSVEAVVRIDSSTIFMLDGGTGQISLSKNFDDSLMPVRASCFSAAIPLSDHSFLFRTLNNRNENVLAKQEIGHRVQIKDQLLKKQIDGLFCTDGVFIKVPQRNQVFYVYYYRNQFIATDTNLNQLYAAKTIDTNSRAKIKLGKIRSSNQVTLAAPPVFVNRQACANQKYLFIRSALRADNETQSTHDENVAIDVYEVNKGKYVYSFYLPDFNGIKLTDFKVYDNILVAQYKHYIYTFKLNL